MFTKPRNPVLWLNQLTGCMSRTFTLRHSLLQLSNSKAVCQLRRVSSCKPASESKLSKAETPDLAPNEALMLFEKASLKHLPVQRGQCFRISDSCQAYSLAVAPSKASLSNQKQCLCRNWAQWKARAALINRLAPACVTQQEPGSFYNLPLSRQHRWILSLLQPIKSQTESKDTTKSATQREEAKLCLLSKEVFWSYHMPVLVARQKALQASVSGS